MSTRKVNTKKAKQLPPDAPLFSREFMRMVQDSAYQTLRDYLETSKQQEAVALLDDLIIITDSMYRKGGILQDRIISEAIGHASYHVLDMGGSFYPPAM